MLIFDLDMNFGVGLKPDVSQVRSHLLEVGPERFWKHIVLAERMPIADIGAAFGLDPRLQEKFGEENFVEILAKAITRFYHKRQKLPQYNTIDDVVNLLRERKNIMVITGAGISTSLGIPDFRSKGSGFYSRIVDEGFTEGGRGLRHRTI